MLKWGSVSENVLWGAMSSTQNHLVMVLLILPCDANCSRSNRYLIEVWRCWCMYFMLGIVRNKNRNKKEKQNHCLWPEGICSSFYFFSLFLIHWNITFPENVSCFLTFDGNLTPNRNSSFHHSLNFCYGFLFSMCHFLKELKNFFFFSALTGMWDLRSPASVPGFKPGPTAKCGGMEAWHLKHYQGSSSMCHFLPLFFWSHCLLTVAFWL